MKTIRIISAISSAYWYADYIGHEFDVIEEYYNCYKLLSDDGHRFIDKKDCVEVVKELVPDEYFEL